MNGCNDHSTGSAKREVSEYIIIIMKVELLRIYNILNVSRKRRKN